MAEVEDTRRTDLGLLQQLNGRYGAKHCHIATVERAVWGQALSYCNS